MTITSGESMRYSTIMTILMSIRMIMEDIEVAGIPSTGQLYG